jgi:hypothetical protein
MTDRHVLDMPIKRFWLMNSSIERVSAQQNIRQVMVGLSSQGGEAAQETVDRLTVEMGTVIIGKAIIDRQGLDDLKQMNF